MYIVFTGHRDCYAKDEDLLRIAEEFPNAIWVHGGAQGVDAFVNETAFRLGIETLVVRPDYEKYYYNKKYAPLARNKQMVEIADLVVAVYDGRQTGGTKFTVEYARFLGKKLLILEPDKL